VGVSQPCDRTPDRVSAWVSSVALSITPTTGSPVLVTTVTSIEVSAVAATAERLPVTACTATRIPARASRFDSPIHLYPAAAPESGNGEGNCHGCVDAVMARDERRGD